MGSGWRAGWDVAVAVAASLAGSRVRRVGAEEVLNGPTAATNSRALGASRRLCAGQPERFRKADLMYLTSMSTAPGSGEGEGGRAGRPPRPRLRRPSRYRLPAAPDPAWCWLASAHLDHTPENRDPVILSAYCNGCHLATKSRTIASPRPCSGPPPTPPLPNSPSNSTRLESRLRPRSAQKPPTPPPSPPNTRLNSPPTRLNSQTKTPIVKATIKYAELAATVTYAARSWPSQSPIPVLAGLPVARKNGHSAPTGSATPRVIASSDRCPRVRSPEFHLFTHFHARTHALL